MAARLAEIASRWFEEVWNQRRVDALDELADPAAVIHDPSIAAVARGGVAEFKEIVRSLLQAVPDIRFEVEDTVEEGDRVALRVSVTGTLTGPGLGIEPTGRPFRITGMALGRYRDGKLVEGWNHFDLLGFFEQVGALKRPI
jgi:steroid delta-isomerase-like uncharacterized protein